MAIKHEWQTTRNLPASVSCSGPSLDVPGAVTIDVPEDPLQSERLTMALEILRQDQEIKTIKYKLELSREENFRLRVTRPVYDSITGKHF